MPTEFEQSVAEQPQQQQELHTQQQQEHQHHEEQQAEENEQYLEDITNDDKINEKTIMTTTATATNGDIMSTSQTSTSSSNGHSGMNGQNGASKKVSITSPDPTAYVAKARVTRPTPPPPSYNPMQFVQIKPCTLYQTAQQQLKKAEEVKKIKEIKKEEPEDWQNNLDNWKSSRRKRVEHIIDRVVEVKKLELEDHDRNRRKSKTFSEMIEERGERGVRAGRAKLVSLAVYNEDESNDLSDLGIGTSSASGKSSLSEDYDNNSVMSDNPELDKAIHESSHKPSSTTREYISSPGYDTSSSTAPASSPDPCEYTYEGAIQDYKQRVSRASSAGLKLNGNGIKSINASGNSASSTSKESTPERSAVNGNANAAETYPTRRGSKIEDRLMGFEVTSPSDCQEGVEKSKVDVPKIDISKRKEVFENQNGHNSRHNSEQPKAMVGGVGVPKVMLRDRFKFDATAAGNSEAQASAKKEVKRLSGDITSIRDRLQSLEQQQHHLVNGREKQSGASRLVDMPMPPLKDRLSSLQNAVTKEEVKKPPVALVDARQLEIMKNEEESAKQRIKKRDEAVVAKMPIAEKRLEQIVESSVDILLPAANLELEPDRDDSGIHTSDDIESTEERNDDDKAEEARLKVEQELQLNAAIAALALEEKQLELAASAVNQIEEEFAELTSTAAPAPAVVPPPLSSDQPPAAAVQSAIVSATNEMEFSVSPTNNLLNIQGSGNRSDSSDRTSSDIAGNYSSVAAVNVVAKAAEVLGPACNLRRKPSNEMVHHRNLLKMFKETFKNDIELDEAVEEAVESEKSSPLSPEPTVQRPTSPMAAPPAPPVRRYMSTNATPHSPTPNSNSSPVITTQIFHSSVPQTPHSPPVVPRSPSMIPRSIQPVGKPPMSPKGARCASKLPTMQSPLSSPLATRKSDGQFSINGRVEIFNSKNMSAKPPTTPTKISSLPYLQENPSGRPVVEAAAPNVGGHIALPQQQPIALEATMTSTAPATSTALSAVTEALTISNRTMPSVQAQRGQIEPHSHNTNPVRQQHQANEVVICAPPVTIVNPDELPKPNTVKSLSSCFAQNIKNESNRNVVAPKPLPRSRIPQTPPQSPTPSKRNFVIAPPATAPQELSTPQPTPMEQKLLADRALSLISNTSSISTDSMGCAAGPFETTALIHSPPLESAINPQATKRVPWKPPQPQELPLKINSNPLAPNDTLSPTISMRSEMPALVVCTPNESSLFKLASSAPPSPVPPASPSRPSDDDIALCAAFLANTRQQTVDELPCSRMDVRDLPPSKRPPCTAYGDISPSTASVTNTTPIVVMKSHAEPLRQLTVEEVICDKVDVSGLPPDDQVPCTPFYEISSTEVKRCDGRRQELGASPKLTTSNVQTARSPSKPNSPIVEARAAHSKALIETCERIIAEERLASNQLKSSLPTPTSPKTTPVLQRKSRIPKPIPCCTGSDSMTKADYESAIPIHNPSETTTASTPKSADEGMLIARLHVVETQIKVTTTTPPASPKVNHKSPPSSGKKTKNIFDFLKKNFGHQQEPAAAPLEIVEPPEETDGKPAGATGNTVRFDEIITVDNSKFYLSSSNETPPPLPLTPAPVNIEITKTITMDEILEEANSEKALSQEINDLLDDELNKLSLDSGSTDSNKTVIAKTELKQ